MRALALRILDRLRPLVEIATEPLTQAEEREAMLSALGFNRAERAEFWEASLMLAQAGLEATDLRHIAEVEARLGSYRTRVEWPETLPGRPAEERAELEEEARELFRVAHPTLEGNGLPVTELPLWIAVARKARKLHGE